MRLLRLLLPLLALLALAPNPAAAKPQPGANQPNWNRVVVPAADGAHSFGSPMAATKVSVYVSYTCPHCAHFEQQGMNALMAGWVRPGKVNFTIRNLVRDRYDLTAALLARCGGPNRFLGNHHALFAAQPEWFSRIQAYESLPTTLPADASQTDILLDIAERTGLNAMMMKRGFKPAQLRACVTDKTSMTRVLAMTRDGIDRVGVRGTPGFVINGTLTEAHDWDSLRPLLPGGGLPTNRT